MPGIFGVIGTKPGESLGNSASALCYGGTSILEDFQEEGIYLASAGSLLFETDDSVLILEGQLLDPEPHVLAERILAVC